VSELTTSSLGDNLAELVVSIPEAIAGRVDSAVVALASAVTAAIVKPLAVGDRAADFELPDALGHPVRLAERLAQGPVVLTFYRGDWCPFCNVELRALEAALPAFRERGASLIAISPQSPDRSMSLVDREKLTFDVLSDVDQRAIRAYGLRCDVVGEARALYDDVFQFDLAEQNGDGSWSVPVPATYVIDRSGTIVAAHADPDYRQRMEVAAIVAALDEANPERGADSGRIAQLTEDSGEG
jgi:peroxiredoxin